MNSSVFWQALGKRAIITSRSVNTLIKLANVLISRLINSKKVCLVVSKPELARYISVELLDKVEILDITMACRECSYTVVLGVDYFKPLQICSSEYIYVFTRKATFRCPRGFRRIHVSSITSNEYLLIAPSTGTYIRFSISAGDVVVREQPAGVYRRALEAIREAMAIYGDLTVKDAVRVLVHDLGVDKAFARRLIEWLAGHRYIRVVKGRITLGTA